MNSITSIKPNPSFNIPKTTSSKIPQSPTFKGTLGKKVVQKIVNKEALTITGVLAMLAGFIGLNKEKVADVIEELINKIKGLQSENEDLKEELGNVNVLAHQKEQDAMAEFAKETQRLRESFSIDLQKKNAEIAQKDAKIAELQKYEAMAKVKSVDELDIVSPEQFIELLKEAKEAMPKAKESAVTYLFTGQGQEEFLAQIERNNKILKAKKDGITKIPELDKAYNEAKTFVGFEPVYIAQKIITSALRENEKATQINYPAIKAQVLKNMNAILEPMMIKGFGYETNDPLDVTKWSSISL